MPVMRAILTPLLHSDAKPALLFDTGTLTSCLQIDMTKSLVLDSCDCKTDVTAKSDKTWNEVKVRERERERERDSAIRAKHTPKF